ncbi:MAG: hypothetical protein DRP83_09050 [Planctomycetota bacterium]|nr:MAG: hypothetical protein DRP83_09050 [Planctomycetota bacterium]
MDALIFDFDGVIFDSEPVHIAGFEQVLEPFGVEFTREEYCQKYLGYDDYEVLELMGKDFGLAFSPQQVEEIVARKTRYLQENLAQATKPIPGVAELISAAAAAGVPQAVCSGGLRAEIDTGLARLGVAEFFPVVLTAEDFTHGKPHPEGYIRAAELLAQHTGLAINRPSCVAIEDSPTGLAAVRAAGMKALAITSTFPPTALSLAHRIEPDLTNVTIEMLEKLID